MGFVLEVLIHKHANCLTNKVNSDTKSTGCLLTKYLVWKIHKGKVDNHKQTVCCWILWNWQFSCQLSQDSYWFGWEFFFAISKIKMSSKMKTASKMKITANVKTNSNQNENNLKNEGDITQKGPLTSGNTWRVSNQKWNCIQCPAAQLGITEINADQPSWCFGWTWQDFSGKKVALFMRTQLFYGSFSAILKVISLSSFYFFV